MKNYKIITLCIFCLIATIGFSQQDALYTQYMFNQMNVNPAYTGTADILNATVASRWQWAGLDGAPKTHTLSINSPIRKKNLGLGITAANDKIGPIEQTNVDANISYQVKVSRKTKLSFGLKAGINMLNVGLRNVKNVAENDNMFANNISKTTPNFGFGIYYYSPNKFYLGVSTPRLIENSLTNEVSTYLLKRHYLFTSGYVFKINNDLSFTPSFLVKYVNNAPVSVDVSANILLRKKVWLGLMYRNGDALGGIVQFQLTNQFKLGYSYDYTISELQKQNTGSHEITLSYDFSFIKKGVVSPRLF